MFGSSNRTIIQTQTSKTQKWVTEHKTNLLLWPFQSWPEPCRKWVRWTEEKKHCHEAVNLKDLEWFWMKECSLISCQVFFNLIRFYRRTFRKVKLENIGFKKYWIKGSRYLWPMCIREKHLFHNDISPHFKFLLSNERLHLFIYFYNRSKGLTILINFHSLLWSYLPRVATILTTCAWYIYIYIHII